MGAVPAEFELPEAFETVLEENTVNSFKASPSYANKCGLWPAAMQYARPLASQRHLTHGLWPAAMQYGLWPAAMQYGLSAIPYGNLLALEEWKRSYILDDSPLQRLNVDNRTVPFAGGPGVAAACGGPGWWP